MNEVAVQVLMGFLWTRVFYGNGIQRKIVSQIIFFKTEKWMMIMCQRRSKHDSSIQKEEITIRMFDLVRAQMCARGMSSRIQGSISHRFRVG